MTILPDAASPAVLAVNVPSPSSLLSSYGAAGLLAIVFPDTGRAGRGTPGPWLHASWRAATGSRKPARQDRPMTACSHITVYIRARSGGRPKGVRCLP